MIRVKFYYHEKQLSGFQLRGHAESGPYGQDIVCAAVSMLTINTINSIEELAGIDPGDFQQYYANQKDGGDIKFKLTALQAQDERVALLLASFKLGIKTTAEQYKDFITIKN